MKNKKIKLVIASGKGGVGKSMVSSSLAMLFAKEKQVVAVDCDVDAPNLHLWLGQGEDWDEVKKISVSEKPVIDRKKCTLCGKCAEICAFQALEIQKDKTGHYSLITNHYFCEGCGACEAVCPQKAIKMKKVLNAEVKVKKKLNLDHPAFPLVSAQLYPGETGSGKIVDQIKKRAERLDYRLMVLDAPAGVGCPVIAAVNGANFALLVTEPTPSGFSDLKRALEVVNHFKIPYGLVINKWDINKNQSAKIENWAGRKLLGKISYDKRVFEAISKLQPILKTDLPAKEEIERIFDKLNLLFC